MDILLVNKKKKIRTNRVSKLEFGEPIRNRELERYRKSFTGKNPVKLLDVIWYQEHPFKILDAIYYTYAVKYGITIRSKKQ